MKSVIPLVLLLLCRQSGASAESGLRHGAWLASDVRWTKAPSTVNRKLQSGQSAVLYLGKDHSFGLIYCTLYRVPTRYITIGQGDPQGVYLGDWETSDARTVVTYRLVIRTVEIKGVELPGPVQRSALTFSAGVLHFKGQTYHWCPELDKDAGKIVSAAKLELNLSVR